MRRDLGVKPVLYPQPVLMIATYNEDGTPNMMNAAWGGMYDNDKVCISMIEHRTTANMQARGAFTVSAAVAEHTAGEDYVGIVSGNEVPDKVSRAGFHVTKSAHVDAPLIDELPVALECTLDRINEDGCVIGTIVNASVDEAVLDAEGRLDLNVFHPIVFDPINLTYVGLGKVAGHAFQDGNALK